MLHSVQYPFARLTKRAVIAGKFTSWASRIEINATDAAKVVIFPYVPAPGSDSGPRLDGDFH